MSNETLELYKLYKLIKLEEQIRIDEEKAAKGKDALYSTLGIMCLGAVLITLKLLGIYFNIAI